MNITEHTRVTDLTAWQFADFMKAILKQEKLEGKPIQNNYCNEEFIHGYAGLANYLKCSQFCVYQRIKSGKYDKAMIRNGKKIIFKKSEVMKVLENSK